MNFQYHINKSVRGNTGAGILVYTLVFLFTLNINAQTIENIQLGTGAYEPVKEVETPAEQMPQKQLPDKIEIQQKQKPQIQEIYNTVTFEKTWTSVFRIDPVYSRHFVNAQGTHLFLLNKNVFGYFGCKDPQGVLEKAAKQGVSLLSVCLEGKPCAGTGNNDLWPWGGDRMNPVFTRFNDRYWDEVETRIKLAGELGIGLNIILYHDLVPGSNDIATQQLYLDKAIRQLGRISNVFSWEIMYENVRNEQFQDAAANYLHKHDPTSRPVFSTGGPSDNAHWPYKPWMDLAVVHTPTADGENNSLKDWYLAIVRNMTFYNKPVLNARTGIEKIDSNNDPVHRRKQAWLWCTSGGYWTWNSLEGCEEIENLNYFGPGWQYLKPLSEYFNSLPFWKMNPNFTTINFRSNEIVSTCLADPEKEHLVAYCCTNRTNDYIRNEKMFVRLGNGTYEIKFLRPSDINPILTQRIIGTGSLIPVEIDVPDFSNDLLIHIERVR